MSENSILILLGVMGILFHCLTKMDGLKKDYQVANLDFHPIDDYFKKDWIAIVCSFIPVVVWFYTFAEVGSKYEIIINLKRTTFFLIGALGSYVFQLVLSRSKRIVRKAVDIKTNIADGVVPPVNNTNKEGLEAIEEDDKP